jgi:hypothetical protein
MKTEEVWEKFDGNKLFTGYQELDILLKRYPHGTDINVKRLGLIHIEPYRNPRANAFVYQNEAGPWLIWIS